MFNVMVVDDEAILRKGLISFVNWEKIGCIVTCEARDGLEAKDKLQNEQIDIAIIDIQMPGMNGLDLCSYISEHYPATKTILLTGYADFSYAQSAIKAGVEDYIIKSKPIDVIEKSVQSLVKKLIYEKEQKQYIANIETTITSFNDQLIEKAVFDVLSNKHPIPDEISRCLLNAGVRLSNFVLLLFSFFSCDTKQGDAYDRHESTHMEATQNAIHLIKNSVLETWRDFHPYCLALDSGTLAVILDAPGFYPWQMESILNTTNEFVIVAKYSQLNMYIGISLPHTDITELPCSLKEAEVALVSNFYDQKNISVFTTTISGNDLSIRVPVHEQLDCLLLDVPNNLRDRCPTAAANALKHIFNRYREDLIPSDQIFSDSISLVLTCWKMQRLSNRSCTHDQFWRTAFDSIQHIRTIEELQYFLNRFIFSVNSLLFENTDAFSPLVNEINEYIRTNYMRDIRLSDFEQRFHVNKNYLSQLYKKESGVGLINFLNQYRMEIAKIALLDPSRKLIDICMSVGIEDPSYFIQLFKKTVGITPGKFRQLQCRL